VAAIEVRFRFDGRSTICRRSLTSQWRNPSRTVDPAARRSHADVFIYYAALLPRRGPHIASHSVCPSVCLSVRPVIITERHVAPPSELQWHTCTFQHAQRAAYRTAISAAQACLFRRQRKIPHTSSSVGRPMVVAQSNCKWNWVSAQGVAKASMMELPDGRKSFKVGLVV